MEAPIPVVLFNYKGSMRYVTKLLPDFTEDINLQSIELVANPFLQVVKIRLLADLRTP